MQRNIFVQKRQYLNLLIYVKKAYKLITDKEAAGRQKLDLHSFTMRVKKSREFLFEKTE